MTQSSTYNYKQSQITNLISRPAIFVSTPEIAVDFGRTKKLRFKDKQYT